MRPLREETGSGDPETAREARLLRAVAPLSPSLARMQRVRMAIEEARPRWWQLSGAQPVLAAGALAVALVAMAQIRTRAATTGPDGQLALPGAKSAPRHHHQDAVGLAPSVVDEAPRVALPSAVPALASPKTVPGVASPSAATRVAAVATVAEPMLPSIAQVVTAGGPAVATTPSPGATPTLDVMGAAVPGGLMAPAARDVVATGGGESGSGFGGPSGTAGAAATFAPATVASGPSFGATVLGAPPATGSDPAPGATGGGHAPKIVDPHHITTGGGRGPGRYEPATIALGTAPEPGQESLALAFTGTLDGKPVLGSVMWNRDDDSIHALVIHRDANDELQVQDFSRAGRAEVGLDIDLDGDGKNDVLIGLSGAPSSDADQLNQNLVGALPAVSVMLHVTP